MIKNIKIQKLSFVLFLGILPMDGLASLGGDEKTNLHSLRSFKTCRSKEELFPHQEKEHYFSSYLEESGSESSLSCSNSDSSQEIFKSSIQYDSLENLTQETEDFEPLTQESPRSISQKRSLEKVYDLFPSPVHKKRKLDFEQLTQNSLELSDEIFPSGPLTQPSSQEILTPELVDSLEDIKDKYDVFWVDIVGVIHNGKEAFKESIYALNTLFEEGKILALVTNTPRPYTYPKKLLLEMGLNPNIKIFTAGDLIREKLIEDYQGKKIYHLGAERNPHILRNLDVKTTTDLGEADVVLLTQYVDPGESIEEFDSIFHEIKERKIPVLCANSDKTAPTEKGTRYCAGKLARRLEKQGVDVKYYGKPYPEIFKFVEKKMPIIQSFPKNRNLFIGDTLKIDIKGAVGYELKTMIVLTGTTAREIEQSSQEEKRALKHLCRVAQARPDHFSREITYAHSE